MGTVPGEVGSVGQVFCLPVRATKSERTMNQVTRRLAPGEIRDPVVRSAGNDALLVDSAISHAEKLRRVLQLEEWISCATPDDPLPQATCRRWQEERERLLAELRLEDGAADAAQLETRAASAASATWLQRLLRRVRPDEER